MRQNTQEEIIIINDDCKTYGGTKIISSTVMSYKKNGSVYYDYFVIIRNEEIRK